MRRRSAGRLAAGALTVLVCAACSGNPVGPDRSSVASSSHAARAPVPAPSTSRRVANTSARPTSAEKPHSSATPARRAPSAEPMPTAGAASAQRLPLNLATGSAKQVLTVTASSGGSTTATLQRWTKVSGGWRKVAGAVEAHLGAAGVGHASERSSTTPAGSFTLTQAFGRDADPGAALPYTQTTPADWWISEPGRLYNTRQRCSSGCPFTRGDPNEHLYYETPFYDYAVVIDYNTTNASGGVRPGQGSAFFLHVTDGNPTAGCVAVPRDDLVQILEWLKPEQQPRILIGIG
ncbi:MAG: L,D-transpeptidase family protein [Jatrophihabitans sp.]